MLFLWSYEKFLERLEMMADWYHDYREDGILNRTRALDPWLDYNDNDAKEHKEEESISLESKLEKIQK